MNWPMIKHVMAKDWYFNRLALMGYFLLGLMSVALLAVKNTGAFYAGAVILISSLIVMGWHLIFVTVIKERKSQTLPFLMSLPISPMDYTVAKMLINVGAFLVIWLLLAVSTFGVILNVDTIPNGLVTFASIALLELVIAFLIILAIAIITESETYSVIVLTISNISVSLFWFWLTSISAIGSQMSSQEIDWNSTVLTFLAVEVVIGLAAICTAFYFQSKKQDFL